MALSKITTASLSDNAVTTAKITDANITTAKIADTAITTAKITDANITTAKVADDAVTNAKIGAGAITNTEVNASAGIASTKLGSLTSALPTGSVLQTLQANKTDKQLIESTSYVDILSQAITPSATSSKILIMAYVTSGGNGHWDFKVTRTVSGSSETDITNSSSTVVGIGDVDQTRQRSASHHWYKQWDGTQATIVLLDHPSTTSTTTYKIKGSSLHDASSYDITVNYQYNTANQGYSATTITSLTVQEIK